MKIKLLFLFVFVSISIQAQFSEEKILEDGTHVIVYTPRHFSAEEIANWKPRRIPTPAEVQKNPLIPLSNLFMINLESTFKISVNEDSSLVAACDKNFLNHVGVTDSKSDCEPVRYHQIWELKESIVNYNYTGFPKSLSKMIKEHQIDTYLSRRVQFFCKEYFYNDKYYLVVVLND
jgi:hypothetical protein